MKATKAHTRKKTTQEQPPQDKFTLFLAELDNKIAGLADEWKKSSETAESLYGDEQYEEEYRYADEASGDARMELIRFKGFKEYTTEFLNRLSDSSNTQKTQL